MFRKLALKANYSSEADNLYEDFFVPVLSQATVYKRAVGYFSLGVLLNAPAAMAHLVEANGRVEIIFGKLVALSDFEAIREGLINPWDGAELPSFADLIAEHPASLLSYRIRMLAWLFANERLEMKVALRPEGLFHQKIGIFEDRLGDHISFSGSMNETISALDPRYNSEEISVFRSWKEGQCEYADSHRANFETLWSGETGSATIVTSIPEAIASGLRFIAEQYPEKPISSEEDDAVDDLVSVLHFLDRLGALLLGELRVAPVVQQAVMQPVLVHCAKFEKQRLVEPFNDLLITLHEFLPSYEINDGTLAPPSEAVECFLEGF